MSMPEMPNWIVDFDRELGAVRELDEEHLGIGGRRRAGLLHRRGIDEHVDDVRDHRRVVRDVVVIAEQKLKRVIARRQRQLDLGLALAEMQMVEVARDRLVERRQPGIDQKMMMAGIGFGVAGRQTDSFRKYRSG